MAIKTLLDSHGGMVSTVVSDAHDSERVVLVTEQDVAPIVDYCKARAELPMDADMKPVAEIPMTIVEQMMRDGRWNDPMAVRAWINDPANKCFRIWKGRV